MTTGLDFKSAQFDPVLRDLKSSRVRIEGFAGIISQTNE